MSRRRVVVVDDDEDDRDQLMDELRDFDFEPAAVIGPFGGDLERLIGEIEEKKPDIVICDHRLQPKGLAQFFGVDVVKRLIALRHPSILLTMYQSPDRLALRQARSAVPVIVPRDKFRLELIPTYHDICSREIASNPVDERKPHRSLIRVEKVESDRIDAVVPSWSPDHAVTVPISCVDASLQPQIKRGTYLLGDVNVGARLEDDLFFANVNEIAPPPKEDL